MKNRYKDNTLVSTKGSRYCIKMADSNANDAKTQEIIEEYNSSLMDLTVNSKPQINMLTLLAEDYIDHAAAIVQTIEEHLQKVPSEIKLPVLYLVDSIVKNVSKAYLSLFTKNIVHTFRSVFEKVDENTRACMWKLRQTWGEVFPEKKLYKLDMEVNNIDPAWPIMSLSSSNVSGKSIHVNPKFFSMQQQASQQQQQQQQQQVPQVSQSAPPPVVVPPVPVVVPPVPLKLPPAAKLLSSSEADMHEQVLKKQKELIELQKQKVELELLQARASLEQQRRQLDKQISHLKPELITSTENTIEKPVVPVVAPSQFLKPIEKQFPAAAASLLKSESSKSGVKIAPASSIAVASAKPVLSRDPRLKLATTTPSVNVASVNAEEFAKQQQLMQQFKLHMQSKLIGEQSSLLNDANKGTSEPESTSINNKSLDNKRAKDSSQKKESVTTTSTVTPSVITTNITTSQRNNSIIKEQSKSSSTKSSSTRSSSSSSSKTLSSSSSSSSSSSRKVGSKSRSKSSSSTSPNKIPKLDENSSQSPEKRSSSKKLKSRKTHSPSPVSPVASNGNSNSSSYRIPRRAIAQEQVAAITTSSSGGSSNSKSAMSLQSGLDEEEQSGSLIVSPPHPPATNFKEIRSSTRMRNYVRRNKEGSRSPEIIEDEKKEAPMPDASKDEDLRAPIVSVNVAAAGAAALDTKEDLDLRVLAVPTAKRQSSDLLESSNVKKSKAEKFDALFGNEDVDLRTLTNPKAGRPPTPPPPVISNEESNKDNCWAKLKTSSKSERETTKPLTDRNRDRLGRPRLYGKTSPGDDSKDQPRRTRIPLVSREVDKHNERNADRNIEIIMKQAAEQLNQGAITKSQYNTLIQEVLHMSEDQKLRAAQRKEQEIGMLVWEKGIEGPAGSQNFGAGNDENIRKDHPPMHPRGPGQGGPRWQGPWHQPWGHPPPGPFPGGPHGFPGGPDGFRPMGPWQNHPRLFGGPMRPDFHPPFHGGFKPRMGPPPPMGPNGPIMMPNGPMKPMGPGGPMNPMGPGGPLGPMPPGMLMGNGPVRPDLSAKRNSPNSNISTANSNNTTGPNVPSTPANMKAETEKDSVSSPVKNSGELPPADPKLLEEIAKDTMKSINIDSVPREIRYYGNIAVVFMRWDDPRDISFEDGSRRIFIDGKDSVLCNINDDYREFTYEGEVHRIKLGTPTRELYVDDKWYECYFGGPPIAIDLGNKKISIKLDGPPPPVKIGTTKRTDLVLGKINLIINARNMVPVFLDAKPQMFEIEGKQCTLEFTDSLQTVLLNGRPFKVEFGGLPKPIIVQSKKHFIRFSILPRNFRAGYVKITGMKGEQPKEIPAESLPADTNAQKSETTSTTTPTTTTSTTSILSVPPGLDIDSTSQDGMDTASSTKSDLQLDVLSSVVPSAMAPSSGLSYQAKPVENTPAPAPTLTLPLNLNELFQRLVETGIVPNLTETKKPEEEEKKEPEIIPVSFDKPETLKIKQPAIVTALYSGMQCSSCGARFAPEMATRYSHHLDWHFRQNRKERDSARKAHSRPWYYDVSDWIQFEEIEDLEDRAQSWFETEKQTAETEGTTTEDIPLETQQPSVPTGSDDESFCEVCHEAFEQFYNEEKEEWHLRPAISFEDKNYHPLCLEDHKRALEKSALVLEETITELEEETKKEENQQEVEEVVEESKSVETKEDDETKPEVKADVDENKEQAKEEEPENTKDEKETPMDLDDSEPIEIIEPLPRKIELEEIDDSSDDETQDTRKEGTKDSSEEKMQNAKESSQDATENKIEEKIPDDVPLIFENVKIKEEPMEYEPEPEESIAEAAAVDTTQVEVKSSIDGNVELDSAAPAMQSAPSKIKINITKNLNVVSKESDESKDKDKDKKPAESPVESAPAKPLIPAAIKPSLQGKKLSILPTVEKGHELSGLCSIM